MLWLRVVCILCCSTQCFMYESYQKSIPNGDRVPHPCKSRDPSKSVWAGVGHLNPGGHGQRNEFGKHFDTHKSWTELCKLDSDGDGKTNGEELGDPQCVWKKGSVARSKPISHPGVCEPISDEDCVSKNRKSGLTIETICQDTIFHCPGISSPDVKNFTLKLNPSPIPAHETTYICRNFDLRDYGIDVTKTYHVIATKPLIDSSMTHHILYYRCDDRVVNWKTGKAELCDMAPNRGCYVMIGGFTQGSLGECHHQSIGFRMGRGGFTRMSLQFHWNNPENIPDQWDESGVMIFYTENLRENDATVFVIGNENFQIPPRLTTYKVTGQCSPDCSHSFIKHNISIVSVINHMHYLGRAAKIEQRRNGKTIKTFAKEKFSYDSPIFQQYDTPITVLSGDELKLTCTFSSLHQTTITRFGEETKDEMCFSFLTVYPATNVLKGGWCTIPNNCHLDPCYETRETAKMELRSFCDVKACSNQTCPKVVQKWAENDCIKPSFLLNILVHVDPALYISMTSCAAVPCKDQTRKRLTDECLRNSEHLGRYRRCRNIRCVIHNPIAVGYFWPWPCFSERLKSISDEGMKAQLQKTKGWMAFMLCDDERGNTENSCETESFAYRSRARDRYIVISVIWLFLARM